LKSQSSDFTKRTQGVRRTLSHHLCNHLFSEMRAYELGTNIVCYSKIMRKCSLWRFFLRKYKGFTLEIKAGLCF